MLKADLHHVHVAAAAQLSKAHVYIQNITLNFTIRGERAA